MPQHLILPPPRRLDSRRASGAGGQGPSRNSGEHGGRLKEQLAETASIPRRVDEGVDPALVFKIRAGSRPVDAAFTGRGLEVLGESADYTYFVLADDGGASLSAAIDEYAQTGNLRSFFNLVEGIEPYGPEDRRGPGLVELGEAFSEVRTFDVAIWPANDYPEAERRAAIVRAVLASSGGTILLESISARRTYLRIDVSADGLRDLLDTSVVELVRTPPVPFLDFRDWRDLQADDISRGESPGVDVGVLDDSPATDHPLLTGLVRSVESLAPQDYQWQLQGNHGTEVTGRVLYPNLHEELRDLLPLTAVGGVRVVRILEPNPNAPGTRFATFAFDHEIVGDAIRHLNQTFGVKVFNISVGYSEPFSELHVGPLTEVIDDLIRDLGVVIIVPSGNVRIGLDARTPSGHHALDDKPQYFYSDEHRVSEPGPAALAVTVGSIALSGAPADLGNRVGWRAAAEPDESSPFSRSGPGLGTAQKRLVKPDFVHYGGNVVINDSGIVVQNEIGASIVTTSSGLESGRLLSAVNGTSYAAPAVARIAADIAYEYPDASANLIRALLASSASPPPSAGSIAEIHLRHRIYGYGRPVATRAISSDSNRVTMTYDGIMPIDTVQIHPLPVPELFRRGSGGERAVTVALAFDPPVRRQRREYLAASMKIDIYRDIDPDELAEILVKQDPDDARDLIGDRRRLKLEPGSNSFTNSTLQTRHWTARNSFVNDDEMFYVVITHRAQTWARNDSQYQEQAYGLAVTLEDRNLVEASLHDLLTQRVRIPARIRIQA